ncbi:flavin reductase family protein [Paraburkholderia hospita]|jgi:flavin reductase (DIM6/NTAB) family NADH-FMN oxidoreductase RutF|uniref:Flavin reductase n=1 Tax=Paraburkholderia hospita TaxID=169430 RepID=A0AAN1JC43_9BURK|nr:flavin reductase family protein [Paraburkholderia hospita]AUT71263.1 flavin reductase [Paraburkholderia hospita]EIM95983.1 nitrilotriacetate monooxygenase component B [Paraburkholderia hospita]OUL87460.1 nitrilotriacetate monooxygenase [Paraburkholderia hospita]SEI16038.1 NADH-FMN oxidoreductase RutF, flavin reductase (DIM6/NTAB) family [Paraburkholderia hospita]
MSTSSIDSRELRSALGRFATGVCVVTTRTDDGRKAALTINSFCSVSLDPPLVAWYLNDRAPSLPVFRDSGYFAVHVLAAGQQDLATHFAKSAEDKFAPYSERVQAGLGDVPVLGDVLACFECKTTSIEPYGDHVMILGQVERFYYGSESPLLFHAGRFLEQSATV